MGDKKQYAHVFTNNDIEYMGHLRDEGHGSRYYPDPAEEAPQDVRLAPHSARSAPPRAHSGRVASAQCRVGASAEGRTVGALHQKFERQRAAAAAIGAGFCGSVAKGGRAIWRTRRQIRDCMTARRGAARVDEQQVKLVSLEG